MTGPLDTAEALARLDAEEARARELARQRALSHAQKCREAVSDLTASECVHYLRRLLECGQWSQAAEDAAQDRLLTLRRA